MKKLLSLFILIILISINTAHSQMAPMGSHDSHGKEEEKRAQPMVQGGATGEIAQPTAKEDTVIVNNKLCASEGTPILEENLGKYTGTVTYNGQNEKYKGKKMIFNYCCPMCDKDFQEKFLKDPDAVLKFHGLIN